MSLYYAVLNSGSRRHDRTFRRICISHCDDFFRRIDLDRLRVNRLRLRGARLNYVGRRNRWRLGLDLCHRRNWRNRRFRRSWLIACDRLRVHLHEFRLSGC